MISIPAPERANFLFAFENGTLVEKPPETGIVGFAGPYANSGTGQLRESLLVHDSLADRTGISAIRHHW